MKVLVLGSGGREHALCWKIKQSKKVSELFVAPGNAGTAELATNLNLDINNFKAVGEKALELGITNLVVGPEEPLVKGIVDYFASQSELNHIGIVGPDAKSAQLEGSKKFAKEFMKKQGIPTAAYASFTVENIMQAFDFIDQMKAPFVLKADGLAAGKGVLIIQDPDVAKIELRRMLEDKKFGDAGNTVVIEEFLEGIEISVFVLTDGNSYKILPSAKDYKRIGEGDTGLNTGGMGAVSPVPFADEAFLQKVEEKIIQPTMKGIREEEMNYKGFIFLGLMVVKGEPYVIEYNVRLGDPETEVVLPRIKNDFGDLLEALKDGSLASHKIEIDKRAACTVVMVSGGYPEAYEKGMSITGINANLPDTIIFHAGTARKEKQIVSNGGRVLAVTSYGDDIKDALLKSYAEIENIKFDKSYYRKDIGFDF